MSSVIRPFFSNPLTTATTPAKTTPTTSNTLKPNHELGKLLTSKVALGTIGASVAALAAYCTYQSMNSWDVTPVDLNPPFEPVATPASTPVTAATPATAPETEASFPTATVVSGELKVNPDEFVSANNLEVDPQNVIVTEEEPLPCVLSAPEVVESAVVVDKPVLELSQSKPFAEVSKEFTNASFVSPCFADVIQSMPKTDFIPSKAKAVPQEEINDGLDDEIHFNSSVTPCAAAAPEAPTGFVVPTITPTVGQHFEKMQQSKTFETASQGYWNATPNLHFPQTTPSKLKTNFNQPKVNAEAPKKDAYRNESFMPFCEENVSSSQTKPASHKHDDFDGTSQKSFQYEFPFTGASTQDKPAPQEPVNHAPHENMFSSGESEAHTPNFAATVTKACVAATILLGTYVKLSGWLKTQEHEALVDAHISRTESVKHSDTPVTPVSVDNNSNDVDEGVHNNDVHEGKHKNDDRQDSETTQTPSTATPLVVNDPESEKRAVSTVEEEKPKLVEGKQQQIVNTNDLNRYTDSPVRPKLPSSKSNNRMMKLNGLIPSKPKFSSSLSANISNSVSETAKTEKRNVNDKPANSVISADEEPLDFSFFDEEKDTHVASQNSNAKVEKKSLNKSNFSDGSNKKKAKTQTDQNKKTSENRSVTRITGSPRPTSTNPRFDNTQSEKRKVPFALYSNDSKLKSQANQDEQLSQHSSSEVVEDGEWITPKGKGSFSPSRHMKPRTSFAKKNEVEEQQNLNSLQLSLKSNQQHEISDETNATGSLRKIIEEIDEDAFPTNVNDLSFVVEDVVSSSAIVMVEANTTYHETPVEERVSDNDSSSAKAEKAPMDKSKFRDTSKKPTFRSNAKVETIINQDKSEKKPLNNLTNSPPRPTSQNPRLAIQSNVRNVKLSSNPEDFHKKSVGLAKEATIPQKQQSLSPLSMKTGKSKVQLSPMSMNVKVSKNTNINVIPFNLDAITDLDDTENT